VFYRGLRFLERCTMRSADHVISTNESYRRLVMDRDGVEPDGVTVVRTGPDPDKLKAVAAIPSLRRGRPHLAAYLGVMGPQDGVDIVIKAAHFVVNTLKRTDISFTLIGSGDCFDELVALRDQLRLGDYVEFTGRVPDETVRDVLSTAVVGLSPDPRNPLNDVSTMNKTMEYMAFGLPVLAFDLRETRASAEEAGVYATPNDIEELSRLLVDLIDDEPRRQSMGTAGRRRIEEKLAWSHQEPHYLSVYDRLLGRKPDGPRVNASHAS
jgi:glycosyltransferase involved in cell wall biosynthesis